MTLPFVKLHRYRHQPYNEADMNQESSGYGCTLQTTIDYKHWGIFHVPPDIGTDVNLQGTNDSTPLGNQFNITPYLILFTLAPLNASP